MRVSWLLDLPALSAEFLGSLEENHFGLISGNCLRIPDPSHQVACQKDCDISAASCGGSMASITQGNPRGGLICLPEYPTIPKQMLSRARMRVSTGATRASVRMPGDEGQEKTLASKPVAEQEFPAEVSVKEKVRPPFQRGWIVQIKPLPGCGESHHPWV